MGNTVWKIKTSEVTLSDSHIRFNSGPYFKCQHAGILCRSGDQCDHSLAFFTRSWLSVVHHGVLVFYRFSWRIGFLLSTLFRNLVNSWLFSLAHLGIYENEECSHWWRPRPRLCPIAKETALAAPTLCTEYGLNGWMDGTLNMWWTTHSEFSFVKMASWVTCPIKVEFDQCGAAWAPT